MEHLVAAIKAGNSDVVKRTVRDQNLIRRINARTGYSWYDTTTSCMLVSIKKRKYTGVAGGRAQKDIIAHCNLIHCFLSPAHILIKFCRNSLCIAIASQLVMFLVNHRKWGKV